MYSCQRLEPGNAVGDPNGNGKQDFSGSSRGDWMIHMLTCTRLTPSEARIRNVVGCWPEGMNGNVNPSS